MKKIFIIFLLLFSFAVAQTTYNGLPLIKAYSKKVDYVINGMLIKDQWVVSPEKSPDIIKFNLPPFPINFVFKTDIDSVKINLTQNLDYKFYVLLNGKDYALTEIICEPFTKVLYDNTTINTSIKFKKEDNKEFLEKLLTEYKLNELIKDCKTDTEKTLKILSWVNKQWKHNGNNEPSKADALTILAEAKQGKNFRCVEYGIVVTSCLKAIGLEARTLGLKTEDVETRESGAGHVVSEVYLKDLKKWAMIDGQWNAMPSLNGIPLNVVEFRNAIADNYLNLKIHNHQGMSQMFYIDWIYPYLFYIDTTLSDNLVKDKPSFSIDGKTSVMLVPSGAKNPKTFQIKYPLNYCLYTNNLKDFYPKL